MADGDSTISVDPIVPQTSDSPPAAVTTPTPTPTPAAPKEETSADMGKLAVEHYQKAEEHMKAMEDRVAPLYDQLQKSLEQPLPQMPKLQQVPQAPDQKALNQQLEKGRLEYLAIALPLAIILGRKGRNASWAAMGAFGRGLAEVSHGNQEAAQQQFKNWQEAAAQVKADNKEKMDQYKEVLENRKLDLSQQMQLIGIISKQYGDEVLHQQAEAKNILGISNNLSKKELATEKFDEKHADLTKAYLRRLSSSEEGRAYGSFIKTKYGFDPYESEDSLKTAEEKFPYSRWDSEYQKQRSTHGEEPAGEEDPLGLKGGTPSTEGSTKALEDIGILGGS